MFTGKFQAYNCNKDCNEFFAVAVPGASGKSISDMKASLEIKQHGTEDVFEFVHEIPTKTIRTVFKFGVPFRDEVPTGNVFESIATKDGNVIRIQSTSNGADYGGRSYEFTDDGLIVSIFVPHMTSLKAERYYKRV